MRRTTGALLLVFALTLSVGLGSAGIAAAADPPELAALWHFDGNADDSSGNGNDGTTYGDASYVGGQSGQALSLDGTGDYMQVEGDSIDCTDAITIEAWIKPAAFSNYDAIVTNFGWTGTPAGSQGSSFRVMADGRLMWRAVLSGDGYYYITSNSTMTVGTWYHVAVTHDSSHTRLYINGQLDIEETPGGTIMDLGKDVKVGWDDFAPDRYFNGMIDEVRIWCGALTAEEIENSYNGVSPTGSVMWLPPITNSDFALQDGTTLPLKFQLFENDVLLTDMQDVSLELEGPAPFVTRAYELGDGADNLRWDAETCSYIVNLKTKDGEWPEGTYTATVIVGGFVYGDITFALSTEKGVGRGNGGN